MIFKMQCRPSYSTNSSTCSSFSLTDHTKTFNDRTCSPSPNHDQISTPRRRRRLEDPIINHASNYYVINPQQTPSTSLQTLSFPSSQRIHQKCEDKNIYCDLFNLLERPLPIRPRKKSTSNDGSNSSSRSHHHNHHHHSIINKNISTKVNSIHKRKCQHQKQSLSSCSKETKHQLQDKKCFYQQPLTNKGFFRRIVRNYFCMPMTINTNEEFAN